MTLRHMAPAGLTLAALWLASCSSPPPPPSSPATKADASPTVELKVVKLDELYRERAVERGKVVVMDIWATW